jgi:hypothetical protein
MTPTSIVAEPDGRPVLSSAPTELPSRSDFVKGMLERTKRRGTPIRRVFVQLPPNPEGGSRASKLAAFTRSSHLDAFLFIHALASAKEPYESVYPASAWARALGLDESSGTSEEDMETAKTQWSKITRKLVDWKLIERGRSGNRARWTLLDESGNGGEYVRPKETKHGKWLTLPEEYWLQDHYRTLSLPAKKMLLIALSSKPGFTLPLERTRDWYGISRSSAQRGLAELQDRGIITFAQNWRFDPSNPRLYSEERSYQLLGPYSAAAIREAMNRRRAVPVVDAADAADAVAETKPVVPKRRRKKTSSKGGEKK